MRVKVGDTWYDPNDIPIMLELTHKDRQNIFLMDNDATKYAVLPEEMPDEEVKVFMEIDS